MLPAGFKPFHEMTPEDYAAVGLLCGLEVHQQLLTRTKLFCRCPAGRYSHDYDAEILRHMRPTLSELGEYDGTALMEKKTRKNIYYRVHRETCCTYEFDDTPPFFISDQALDIALELGLLLRLNMVNELHIARKQYLDGSIPTGFQRTTIVGVDGWIPYKDRRIGVRQLGLEEDSCREVSDAGHDRVYITDRLGMPLIEIVTEPHMVTPQECAEVCEVARMLCRSTGKVRRGYGATREDVNVSVRGGTRIEIKGVPQITRIPHLIYNEAMRQCSLLEIRNELHVRGVTAETLRAEPHDLTRAVERVQYQPLRAAVDAGLRVGCVVLRQFGGLLNRLTQEHTTFAKEFSDRIRVIACLTALPNMVHSDTAAEALTARDWKHLRRKTGASEADALILVWGSERDTRTACEEIAIRAREATQGIPSDTRQALKDGTNGFERVLPGPQRMYPDTDLPPIEIRAERLERIRSGLPPFVWDREARYRVMNLPADTVRPLCMSPRAGLFDRVVDELSVDPTFAAVVLIQRLKGLRRELARKGDPAASRRVDALPNDDLFEVFRAFSDGRLAREGVPELIEHMVLTPPPEPTAVTPTMPPTTAAQRVEAGIAAAGMSPPLTDGELPRHVAAAMDRLDAARFEEAGQQHRWLMGRLMKQCIGRVAGVDLSECVAATLQPASAPPRTRARA